MTNPTERAGYYLSPNHVTKPDHSNLALRVLIDRLGLGGRPQSVAVLEANHGPELDKIEAELEGVGAE